MKKILITLSFAVALMNILSAEAMAEVLRISGPQRDEVARRHPESQVGGISGVSQVWIWNGQQ